MHETLASRILTPWKPETAQFAPRGCPTHHVTSTGLYPQITQESRGPLHVRAYISLKWI